MDRFQRSMVQREVSFCGYVFNTTPEPNSRNISKECLKDCEKHKAKKSALRPCILKMVA